MKFKRIFTIPILACAAIGLSTAPLHAEDWHRIHSADKKASVLFPVPLDEDKVVTKVEKSPAGEVSTRVLGFQDEGMMFTISSSRMPPLALKLAGEKKLLKISKNQILAKAFSEETSFKRYTGMAKPTVMVLKYESADLEDKSHPGFTGLAAVFIVDLNLYVINSMMTNGIDEATKAKNLAAQDKLLQSVTINP